MPGPPTETNSQLTPGPAVHTGRGKRWLAVGLNVLLPGLGLLYLARWRWALANFLVVQGIVAACFLVAEPTILEHIHWVFLILMVGSGAVAHALTKGPA